VTPRRRIYTAAIVGGSAGSLAMDVVQYTWALGRTVPGVFRPGDAAAIGRVIHYGFGIAFAAAYLTALPRRQPAIVRGAMFGIVLWLISDRLLIPLFKLGRPWSRYSVSERSNALVSHLAYALIVEFARR
jgi:uncharacterized membrane protein YagU involved in acid resistance